MGSRLLSSKKLGARVSLASLSTQIVLGSLTLGLVPTAVAAAPTCNGLTATIYVEAGLIVGGPNNGAVYAGTLNGTVGANVIVGTNGADIINGAGGHDTVCALDGSDEITTGTGNDWIDAGEGDNTIDASSGANKVYSGDGNDSITVGVNSDTIEAGGGTNTITSAGGHDTVTTGDGDDTITLNGGHNTVVAGNGDNVITTSTGNDTITTGDGDDIVDAGSGGNEISVGSGNNQVTTGVNSDTITATGNGDNVINAGGGNNTVTTGDGDDEITTTGGHNTIVAGHGNNRITTSTGNDTITTGDGDDVITAGNGANTLNSGGGDDILTGGVATDTGNAGAGNDSCSLGGQPGDNVLSCETTGQGTIVVVKDADPNAADDFSFTLDTVGHATSVAFDLDDDADGALANSRSFVKPAGSYVAAEAVASGWDLADLTCVDPDSGTATDLGAGEATIDLDSGETVTCTFLNEVIPLADADGDGVPDASDNCVNDPNPFQEDTIDVGDGYGDACTSTQTVVVMQSDLDTTSSVPAVVFLAGLDKWFFYNDDNDTVDNSLGSMVYGPATPPAGNGSAQMAVSGTDRKNIATYQFDAVPLADISVLEYTSLSQSAGNGSGPNAAPYLQFNVDFDGSDTWQRRLLFLPSDNGTVLQDTWQTWDAIDGGSALWRYSGATWPAPLAGPNVGVTGVTGTKTWNQILIDYPAAKTRTTDSWLGIRVGEPYPSGFTGNVDSFSIKIEGDRTTFDFEPLKGTLHVTKYECVAGTAVSRALNGPDASGAHTAPSGCVLDDDIEFGYIHQDQANFNPPYLGLGDGSPYVSIGMTDANGEVSATGLAATGRYNVAELDGGGQWAGNDDTLGFYCYGDSGDVVNNYEVAFVTQGGTAHCVAYNEGDDIVMTLGYETVADADTPGIGSCPVIASDLSANGGTASLQHLEWTYVPTADHYDVYGYSWNGSSWSGGSPYSLSNLAGSNQVIDGPNGTFTYKAFATNEGTYAYQIKAIDSNGDVIGETPAVVDGSFPCTFTVDRSAPPSLAAPTLLGWNVETESATLDESPVDLSCGASIDNGQNSINQQWTAVSGTNVKYIRRVSNDGGSSWNELVGMVFSTNHMNGWFSFGPGESGTYLTGVKAFEDANANNVLDSGELESAWSNDCQITYANVDPPVCGNNVIESGEQCDDGNVLNGDGCSNSCQLELAACVTTDDFLVARWELDAGTGSVAYDAATVNNEGSVNGASWIMGVLTSFYNPFALSFDGTDDVVDVSNKTDLDITGPFTVSAWVKSDGPSDYGIIAGTTDNADLNGYYVTINQATGFPTVYSLQGATYQSAVVNTSILGDGSWHHIAGIFDGTNLTMYLDGVAGAPVAALAPTSNVQSFRIGASHYPGRFFTGGIDDVRVYNAALDDSHVFALAAGECNAGITAPPPPADTDLDTIPDSIDNCVFDQNVDQIDTDGDGQGDACDATPTGPGSGSSGGGGSFSAFGLSAPNADGDTGARRGKQTNILGSLVTLFGGPDTTNEGIAPGAFGGPGEEEFTDEEADMICRMRKAMPEDVTDAVLEWVAQELARKMPHSVEAIVAELEDGGVCPQAVTAGPRGAKPVAFHLDAQGYPVSSNDTWNKCIRGTATLQDIRNNPDRDEDGYGVSCSRYHTSTTWRHPDLGVYFTWKKGSKAVGLPAGYALKQDAVAQN